MHTRTHRVPVCENTGKSQGGNTLRTGEPVSEGRTGALCAIFTVLLSSDIFQSKNLGGNTKEE